MKDNSYKGGAMAHGQSGKEHNVKERCPACHQPTFKRKVNGKYQRVHLSSGSPKTTKKCRGLN